MPNQLRITNMTTKTILLKLEESNGSFSDQITLKLANKHDFNRDSAGVYKLSLLNVEAKMEEHVFTLNSPGVYQIERNFGDKTGFKIKDNLTNKEFFSLNSKNDDMNSTNFNNELDNYANNERNSVNSANDFSILKSNSHSNDFGNSAYDSVKGNSNNINNNNKPFGQGSNTNNNKNNDYNNSSSGFNFNFSNEIPKSNLIKLKNESNENLMIQLFRDEPDAAPECSFISKNETKSYNRNPGREYELTLELVENLKNDLSSRSGSESKLFSFLIRAQNNYVISDELNLINEAGFTIKNKAETTRDAMEQSFNKNASLLHLQKEAKGYLNSNNKNDNSNNNENYSQNTVANNTVVLKNNSGKDIKISARYDKNLANENNNNNNYTWKFACHIFCGLFNRIILPAEGDLSKSIRVNVNDEFYFSAWGGYSYEIDADANIKKIGESRLIQKKPIPEAEKENSQKRLEAQASKKTNNSMNVEIFKNLKLANSRNLLTKFKSRDKKIEFVIANGYSKAINVRMKSDGLACEDFFHTRFGEKRNFSRLALNPISNLNDADADKNCFYLLEILDDEFNSIRFYVSEQGQYVFDKEKKLVFKSSNEFIPETDDCIDEDMKKILAQDGKVREINYNHGFFKELGKKTLQLFTPTPDGNDNNNINSTNKLNGNNNNNNVNNNPNNYSFINPQNKSANKSNVNSSISHSDPNSIPYFLNIAPNYTPGNLFTDSSFPADTSMIDPEYESESDPTSSSNKQKSNNKIRKAHFVHSENSANLSNFSAAALSFLGGFSRPSQIFRKQYYLFKDNIEPNDVIQGTIGNCYLVSIFAAIAEQPELIQKIFKTRSVNPDGFYEIYYYYEGRKHVMFIDDVFPTFDKILGSKKMLFAEPNEEEIWVCILEKAYAKFEGGYKNIIGGLIYPELQFFLGCETKEFDITESDLFWTKLEQATHDENIVCCRSKFKSGNENAVASKNNIVFGHAYTILDAKEYVSKNNGKRIRLVQIRNPYGASHVNINGETVKTEWTGDFCDSSPLWTEELKNFFDYEIAKGDNGIFFMSFGDFVKEFDSVVVGYI